jgi:hypothetical protein
MVSECPVAHTADEQSRDAKEKEYKMYEKKNPRAPRSRSTLSVNIYVSSGEAEEVRRGKSKRLRC